MGHDLKEMYDRQNKMLQLYEKRFLNPEKKKKDDLNNNNLSHTGRSSMSRVSTPKLQTTEQNVDQANINRNKQINKHKNVKRNNSIELNYKILYFREKDKIEELESRLEEKNKLAEQVENRTKVLLKQFEGLQITNKGLRD